MGRNEDGFTLLEMLAVMAVMAILVAIAVGFQAGARERAADAAAKSNIGVAVPAFHAYYMDHETFVGMDLAGLQATYSPGITDITVVSADDTGYCVSSTVEGRSWYKPGPAGRITTTRCR